MGSFLFFAVMLALSWWLRVNFAQIKGFIGEKHVSTLLQKLDPNNYILMNDIHIPKKNGSTSQIDHMLISHKGLFVIKTKNYKGLIMGSENSQYWTQVIYKRKERFYNPIWQNLGHIKTIQEFLGNPLDGVPIYSIVVFSNQTTFKFKVPFKKAKVIKSKDLLSVIQRENGVNLVSDSKRQKIQQQLSSLFVTDKEERKKQKKMHVANIKQDIADRILNEQMNVCPRCGGHLVVRKGKYGKFKGCSNYPKCRYTV
ncbi:NERD domain-containing protein [Niallia oryzisoli]|uniref:NERD domain-containing protein n=1 Tax=Niallia oryzisoli TaxID=1737571 RepID=A0ABZ2CIP7_9BACI